MSTKIFFTAISIALIFGCTPSAPTADIPVQIDEPIDQEKPQLGIYYPIDNFESGITLKPFGIYIDSKTSPVQPERFSGYHTGADIETSESLKDSDVPIYAIADGVVKLARTASGYGGVIAVEHQIDGQSYIAIYGHIDLESVNFTFDEKVLAGQKLAILGDGYSAETDNERKHLHFAMKPGSVVDLSGYVNSESGLNAWIDPVEFLKSHNAVKVEQKDDQKAFVESYIRENISELNPEKAVLGGTWYVLEIEFIDENTVKVLSEDGHIQSSFTADYTVDENENVQIIFT